MISLPTSAPQAGDRSAHRALSFAAALAGAGFAALAAFPGFYQQASLGLDPSYQLAINTLPHSPQIFGRDLAFTFGPLGYLLMPFDFDDHLAVGNLARAGAHVFLVGLAVAIAWRSRRAGPALLCCGLLVAAAALGQSFDWVPVIVTGAAAALALERGLAWPLLLAGALAAVGLFTKFNLGVACASVVAIALLVAALWRGPRWRLQLGAGLFGYAGVLAILVPALFGRLGYFVRWLRMSLEITRGFDGALYFDGGTKFETTLALACMLAAGLVAAFVRQQSGRPIAAALVFLPSVFFAFKHGFVRQDVHTTVFHTFLASMVAVVALFADRPRALRPIGVFAALVLATGLQSQFFIKDRMGAAYSADRIRGVLDLSTGRENLRRLLHLREMREGLAGLSAANGAAARDSMPAAWRALFNARPAPTVGVAPIELSLCVLLELKCVYSPVLQLYQVYTPALDAWTAEHFRGPDAPELLLLQFRSVDGRQPVLDTPLTWRALLARYEPQDLAEGWLLLKRRPGPAPAESRRVVQEGVGHFGDEVPIPPSERPLVAALRFHPTLLGRLRRALLRARELRIAVRYASGRRTDNRLIPDMGEEGRALDVLPSALAEVAQIAQGQVLDRVASFTVYGRGARDLGSDFGIQWLDIGLPKASSGPVGAVFPLARAGGATLRSALSLPTPHPVVSAEPDGDGQLAVTLGGAAPLDGIVPGLVLSLRGSDRRNDGAAPIVSVDAARRRVVIARAGVAAAGGSALAAAVIVDGRRYDAILDPGGEDGGARRFAAAGTADRAVQSLLRVLGEDPDNRAFVASIDPSLGPGAFLLDLHREGPLELRGVAGFAGLVAEPTPAR